MNFNDNFVGLFAAGGQAKRLKKIHCSKEVLPLPQKDNPKHVVGDYLLSAFASANINTVYVIIRTGKWDIPQCLGSGKSRNLNISYLILDQPWGTPFTLDQSWPFIQNKNVAIGFPDIIIKENNTFIKLKKKLSTLSYDVVLGLFNVQNPSKFDMVQTDDHGDVICLNIKPARTTLKHTWVIAVWRPTFTQFMHQYLQKQLPVFERDPDAPEPYVGTVINAAIDRGMKVGTVVFDNTILDIGTPEDLENAYNNT